MNARSCLPVTTKPPDPPLLVNQCTPDASRLGTSLLRVPLVHGVPVLWMGVDAAPIMVGGAAAVGVGLARHPVTQELLVLFEEAPPGLGGGRLTLAGAIYNGTTGAFKTRLEINPKYAMRAQAVDPLLGVFNGDDYGAVGVGEKDFVFCFSQVLPDLPEAPASGDAVKRSRLMLVRWVR